MSTRQEVLDRLTSLRLHQQRGRRAPHKPLLVLLALGQLARDGSSELPWSRAQERLSDLIAEFGPASKTGRAQSAAYPFTRLRSDGVWTLNRDVPMDLVGPLTAQDVVGRLDTDTESVLRRDPELVRRVARALVEQHFPPTIVPDVLTAAGLDPDDILQAPGVTLVPARRRDASWRVAVLQAWDRQCAFCGYDGQLGHATVGVEAAHVRWWAFDGPDSPDNGLALCVLHHKLFDFGALGLDADLRIEVSAAFTARTPAGRSTYDLHGKSLRPRPGTQVPAADHISWHRQEVFKGESLAA
ncbi:HNH endonuclease [Micromonospora peucetia]|uniref:HNH endonuclease n=1 Tax=Micromonospora peucetia TaxID=47871 RepID=A0A1C6UCM1_9ACTN|nr:HNH endonuclease [Micromonospora peucetia]MCX4386482.1 HNH endonuclease [Micromonospora peucetia]WSA33817.1 HNH endonuclease [Micromonospora peucetia]SCL51661.1 putative restriction endonuclease [Micromonospora peucetia]